ncbi:MAG TPA: PfkB family carbohydrate kinase [Pyrinomonadaceae bacterium]|nr:PfkB family carbohydrate kinase [Pyrinomonadaceae bacterium]
MSLLVVGSVAYDAVETPFGKRERMLGGAATHFSLAASFFTDVRVVGVIGGDFEPQYMSLFAERGINTDDLEVIPDGKTFFWRGKYDFDLNTAHTLDTQLNVFADFDPKLSEESKNCPYVFLGNIQPDLQLRVSSQVKQSRLVAIDTMNYWISSVPEAVKEALSSVHVCIINDAETRQLAGEANLIRAARKILSWGPRALVVKRGEYGAAMFTAESYFAMPAYPLESVFDPTGAGDTFAGGFMGYLSGRDATDEGTMRRAMIYGSVMASFNVEEFGTERVARLTHDEINERFRAFKRMTHFDEIPFERAAEATK